MVLSTRSVEGLTGVDQTISINCWREYTRAPAFNSRVLRSETHNASSRRRVKRGDAPPAREFKMSGTHHRRRRSKLFTRRSSVRTRALRAASETRRHNHHQQSPDQQSITSSLRAVGKESAAQDGVPATADTSSKPADIRRSHIENHRIRPLLTRFPARAAEQ